MPECLEQCTLKTSYRNDDKTLSEMIESKDIKTSENKTIRKDQKKHVNMQTAVFHARRTEWSSE